MPEDEDGPREGPTEENLSFDDLSTEREEEDEARTEEEEIDFILPDSRPAILEPQAPDPAWRMGVPLGLGLAAGGAIGLLGGGTRRRAWSGLAVLAGVGLAGLSIYAQQRRPTPRRPYDLEPLNRAPGQITRIPVDGHGEIKVGRTDIRLANGVTRPFISIWIPPEIASQCNQAGGTYRWYQFVRISFYIGTKRKRLRKKIKGATGLMYPFDEWTPDYHSGDPGSVGPDLRPPGLNLPQGVNGKPFKPYGIGGQRTGGGTSLLDGVLDAPDFTPRTNKLSPMERLYRRFVRTQAVTQRQQPQGWSRNLRVVTEARTYLVCVAGGQAQCIGFVSWTYENAATVTIGWKAAPIGAGLNPTWTMTSSLGNISHTLRIGGWTAGC